MAVMHLVASTGAELGALVEELTENRAAFLLPLKLVDGAEIPYRLEVIAKDAWLSVRELGANNLPRSCPQRHINGDGTFCLYWAQAEAIEITTVDAAREWWGTLWKFLNMQARAANLRKWPAQFEWAHGDAARFQKAALEAASNLGKTFEMALTSSALVVETRQARNDKQGALAKVFVDGRHLYSVWLKSGKVVNRKQRCFCGSSGRKRPARLKSCNDHAEDAARLALNKILWEERERAFWATLKGKPCCGTMNVCPLRDQP